MGRTVLAILPLISLLIANRGHLLSPFRPIKGYTPLYKPIHLSISSSFSPSHPSLLSSAYRQCAVIKPRRLSRSRLQRRAWWSVPSSPAGDQREEELVIRPALRSKRLGPYIPKHPNGLVTMATTVWILFRTKSMEGIKRRYRTNNNDKVVQ